MSPYVNSYYDPGVHNWSPAYSSQVTHCEGVFLSSLSEWLLTAPITYGPLVPEMTLTDVIPGTLMTISSYTDVTTMAWTYTETVAVDVYSGATSLSVTTVVSVDFAGVAHTYPQTVAMVETTIIDSSFSGSWYAATTSTVAGFTGSGGYVQAAYYPAGYATNFTFVPMTPCCKECTLFGGNVQVYYWPTATEAPPISTLVDSAKFTLCVWALNSEYCLLIYI